MRLRVLFLRSLSSIWMYCIPVCAFAQSTTSTFTTDINGYRVAGLPPTVNSDHTQTQVSQSINGRQVPLEQREEKVLRKDATSSTTETIIRRYNPEGQLTSTERIVTEAQKTSDGGSNVHATTYRSDVNGHESEVERSNAETRVSGNTTTTNSSVARPTINGSFETTEKRAAVTTGTEADKSTTETVYRPSENGGLSEATRTVKQESKKNGQTTVNVADYEPGVTGQMELHSQSVTTTTKQPDGTETSQVDLYGASADGHVRENGGRQQLKEEQIVTRRTGSDGSVTETLSVRRPTISDPTHLGNLQKISETVCQGQCTPAPAAAPAPAPAAAAKTTAQAGNN